MATTLGPAVVYFAKVPAPGRVKTRLCPPLTPVEAAALYRAFLIDGVREVEGARSFVWGWPADELQALESLVPDSIEVRPQRGEGLWERMADCFDALFAEGYGPVLIRNTDSPDLPAERVQEALAACQRGHVVLGPDVGGGYYLIGLSEPQPDLLNAAVEGAATVLEATVARARELGLPVHLLAEERDVDTYDDLLAAWSARQRRADQ